MKDSEYQLRAVNASVRSMIDARGERIKRDLNRKAVAAKKGITRSFNRLLANDSLDKRGLFDIVIEENRRLRAFQKMLLAANKSLADRVENQAESIAFLQDQASGGRR